MLKTWHINHRTMSRRTKALQADSNAAYERFAEELSSYEKRLLEVGVGLIRARNAQPLQEKTVERYIRRQRLKLHELSAQRLRFLKIQRALYETKLRWRKISVIDPNDPKEKSIMEYERLRALKQYQSEKLEDRKSDVQALENKCRSLALALAHVREKANAAQYDILYSTEMLEGYEEDAAWIRYITNSNKMARDRVKREIEKTKSKCGLLLRPELLKDMMNIINKVEEKQKELKSIQEHYQKEREELVKIRAKMHERSKQKDILRAPFRRY